MKSLKFADLKGTKTAVNCRTQEEWDKVTAICGYEWVDLLRWGEYRENSCISLNGLGYADTEFYTNTYRYTIIPALVFIAANTEATPEWLEHAEQPKEESEDPQTKQLGPTIVEVLVSVQNQLSDLSAKVESLEKQLSQISPKPINPELPQPEPKSVVLPVTVEEVEKYRNSKIYSYAGWAIGGISGFMHTENDKKSNAFHRLLKIAEAQNEIVPKWDKQFYARGNISNQRIEIMAIATTTAEYSYGIILFNSEQGLYGCIEANRELWMDLLRG